MYVVDSFTCTMTQLPTLLLIILLFFCQKCENKENVTIKYLLYTQDNMAYPIFLNSTNPFQIRQEKKIIILIHGEMSSPHVHYFPNLRVEYLTFYDCNVIMVDWSKVAFDSNPNIAKNLNELSKKASDFLCEVQKLIGFQLQHMHLIGHSIGAHLAGLIGQETKARCNAKIGRITGLDPHGQIFQRYPINKRLDSSDALFVDVIHTDEFGNGYYGNCGSVDFHVNCGGKQKGCPDTHNEDEDPDNEFVDRVACSKTRSVKYMIESLSTNNFMAESCTSCPQSCKGDQNAEYIKMGEDCPKNSSNTVFWLPTNSKPPFGVGCSQYKFTNC